MGSWGARIYEDDTALDIRGDFLEQLRNGASVAEIEKGILDEYAEDSPAEDQGVYMALACVELETGTLSDQVKQKALKEIEQGPDPKAWGELIGTRRHEFTLIKKYINAYDGKPVKRKSWTELQKGDAEYAKAMNGENVEADRKLDDATWQTLDDEYEDLPEEEYYAIAGAHLACFVYWLITRNYLNVRTAAAKKDAAKVKDGSMLPIKFVDKHMDLKLFSVDATQSVRNFVNAYYDFTMNGPNPSYLKDYYEVVKGDREEFSFVPTKQERDGMARKLDERLKEYTAKPYTAVAEKKSSSNPNVGSFWWWVVGLMLLGFMIYHIATL